VSEGRALVWRPLAPQDGDAWAGLMRAVEQADGFGEHFTAADLDDELGAPTIDLAQDTWAALDGDEMVAFGIVGIPTAPTSGVYSIDVWGGVRPSHRQQGVGRRLLRLQCDRAVVVRGERFAGAPTRLTAHALERTEDRRRLLEHAGFSFARWFFDMERDLAEPVADPAVPEGLRLVPYDPAHDEEVRVAHNECFAAHWGSSERSPEMWRRWFTGNRHFRPDLSALVLDGDELVAYALCQRYPEEDEAQGYTSGWLGQLGTRRPWRGRGLGTALLRRVVRGMQDDGLERAALQVDSENVTGALALYEREGFRSRIQKAAFTLALAPQDAPSASGSH
jgi:ribosomal protein S18 acetylase RimI-like enzyme